MRTSHTLPLLLVLLVALAAVADEPAVRTGLAVGETVADFALRDLAGVEHRLSSMRSKKAIVLAFNGLGCPISEVYTPRLQRFSERWSGNGVQVLGINSNRFDRVDDLRGWANASGVTFPLLKDHGNVVADALGVERMTEVLVIDGSRRLRYRGRIDDQYAIGDRSVGTRKDRVEKSFLEDAVAAIVAGEDVPVKKSVAFGCVISRERKVVDSTSITFHRDVAPIVQKRCQSCHREGAIGPFELESYEDVAGWSGMIREVVVNRRMPPWHADPAYGHFSNDRSLEEREIETLVTWIDNGTPKGDPAQAPKAPETPEFPQGWQIGTPDAVFEAKAFTVPAEGTVPYRYAVVETNLKEERWVVAAEIQPGEPSVVHHILVFAIDPENPRRWRRATGGGTKGYFAAMVPGQRPQIYPPGTGKRLPAGATLVFQVHYTVNGTEVEDRSRIGLVFADERPAAEVHTRSAVNQLGLVIPPRAERHEVTATHRFRRPVRMLSMLPHMHVRGEAFRYELHLPVTVEVSKPPVWSELEPAETARFDFSAARSELTVAGSIPDELVARLEAMYEGEGDRAAIASLRGAARTEVLLNVPRYDFGWQNTYRLEKPVDIPAGALLVCVAHYDNSPYNPVLTEAMYSKSVFWGDQTWEEMLIGYFDFVHAD